MNMFMMIVIMMITFIDRSYRKSAISRAPKKSGYFLDSKIQALGSF